jgi:hypothetical protein
MVRRISGQLGFRHAPMLFSTGDEEMKVALYFNALLSDEGQGVNKKGGKMCSEIAQLISAVAADEFTKLRQQFKRDPFLLTRVVSRFFFVFPDDASKIPLH